MSEVGDENGGHGFIWFLIGVVFGVAGALLAPRWAEPYLPDFLGGETRVEGEVLDKLAESDRILVKVSTPEGLILVTFTQNLRELDLLIKEGDSITLGLDGYETLVENPSVARVIGSASPVETPPGAEGESGEPAAQQDAAEVPGSAATEPEEDVPTSAEPDEEPTEPQPDAPATPDTEEEEEPTEAEDAPR